MDEETRRLFLDIQHWMMDNDHDDATVEGKELFDRISKLTGVDWDQPMAR